MKVELDEVWIKDISLMSSENLYITENTQASLTINNSMKNQNETHIPMINQDIYSNQFHPFAP